MLFQRVTIAGVGLLGGSLGLALKRRGLARHVEGLVRRAASVGECEGLGVVDHATRDPQEAGEGADLVVLCTPLARMKGTLERLLPVCRSGVVVTDVGSAKLQVVRELEPLASAANAHFVGSHPMAGAEKSGPAAASPDLFEKAVCVVTPTPRTSTLAIRRVRELWEAVGGRVLRLKPEVHDDFVSRSSHLPHVVASELAHYVLSPAHPVEQHRLCATGFRDTTRVASSSPEMWRDVVLANREHLARVLGVFVEGLEEFRHSLETGDARAILEFFEQAKARRDAWVHGGSDPSPSLE